MFRCIFSRTRFGTGPMRDATFVALVLCCGLACAAEPVVAARYRIDQPQQPLGESLRAIARQTGASVLFDPSKVSGRMSKAVSGQLTAAEAITLAAEGSGLVTTVMADGAIVVRAAGSPVTAPSAHPPSLVPASAPRGAVAPAVSAALDEGEQDVRVHADDAAASLGRVEVTGSRLKRIDADGPTPVNVYTRADIDRSGQPTLERFLSSLNEASVSTGEGAAGQTTGQGSVQLRGLPLGSTLVMINGRRVQAVGSSSGNYFNLSLIPMAAVERVEIVPVGSSAVYGGDALAGVVNIILKKSLDGLLLESRVASGRGVGDRSVSVGTGGGSAMGAYLLLGSYNKTTPLTMAEREFFRDGDYRRFGGVDARTRSCTPGTVSSANGANLPGLSSSFAAIPAVALGQPLTAASFVATAGQANLCNPLANGHGQALVYETETYSLHAAGERRLTQTWSVFGELTYARHRLRAEQGGIQLNNVLVPANNPHNPFGVAVRVTARLGPENGAEMLARDTDFKRVLFGVRGDIGAGWDLEASVSSTRDDGGSRLTNTSAKVPARTAALGASTVDAALNPFTTGLAASEAVLRSIWSASVRDSHGRKDQASAFLRGSVAEISTGSVDVIAGLETARDRYRTVTVGTFDILGRRSNSAAYGELRVPLWRGQADLGAPAAAGAGPRASWEVAALTVAARRDHYSDFGSANTVQAGLEVRPTRATLLRASTATSFKPPTLLQANVDEVRYTTEAFGLLDPTRANAPIVGGEVLRATNVNLNPERGRAFSLGAVWEPESAAGTRLAATVWRVKINGLISLLWPQVALDNEALFPGFVTRAPAVGGVPGAVTQVFYSEVNYGHVDTAGADMEVAHAWKAAGAKWTVSAGGTRTNRYDVVVAPGAPVEHRLGRRAVDYWAPKWRARLSAGVEQGAWSVGVTSRFLGSYRDMAPSERELGGFWVHDLAATVNLKRLGFGLSAWKDASLSLAIANVADRQPEYVGTSPFYDVTQADWRGRYTNVRLSMSW